MQKETDTFQVSHLQYDKIKVNKSAELKKSPNIQTYRKYLLFLSGQLITLLGSSIVQFTIIWWITIKTNNAMFLSISMFLAFLPQLIIFPLAGIIADKYSKKITIILADFSQACLTFGLILMFTNNYAGIWTLIIFNCLRAAFQALHSPAIKAIIPTMVPKEKLTRVNGINSLFSGLISILGPVLGAFLLIYWPLKQILWIDILTFLIGILPLLFIKFPTIKTEKKTEIKTKKIMTDLLTEKNTQLKQKKDVSFIHELTAGFNTLRSTPGLLILALWATMINFFNVPHMTLIPFFINNTHSGSKTTLAIVMAFLQAGSIFGALFATIKKKWNKKWLVLMGCGVLLNFGGFISAIAPGGVFMMINIGEFILGFNLALSIPLYFTILQNAVTLVITPLGILISGILVELIGIVNVFMIFSILGMITSILFYFLTDVKNLTL
ncbi:MAG: MFS transporter [Promethearchaeota archaeon]